MQPLNSKIKKIYTIEEVPFSSNLRKCFSKSTDTPPKFSPSSSEKKKSVYSYAQIKRCKHCQYQTGVVFFSVVEGRNKLRSYP